MTNGNANVKEQCCICCKVPSKELSLDNNKSICYKRLMGHIESRKLPNGKVQTYYVPLYGTVGYLIEQVEHLLAVERSDALPMLVNKDYIQGRIGALENVLALAREMVNDTQGDRD